MKRPYLVNFICVKNQTDLSIRASVSKSHRESQILNDSVPYKSLSLIRKYSFRLKLLGHNNQNEIVFQKEYETDNYGNIEIKLPRGAAVDSIQYFNIYETSTSEGISFILGTYYLESVLPGDSLVISDFDKTLCETRFSTLREIYHSLKLPLNNFPPVKESLDILRACIESKHHVFILSASPHFYERAITDWLYQNEIHTSHVFLKDYRDFFTVSSSLLSIKDVKEQGFYKLNQLVRILGMTGVPQRLVLMGDAFEADPLIYLTLYAVLHDKEDPWSVWNYLRDNKVFRLTHRQHSLFLSKLYSLSEEAKRLDSFQFEIYIRYNTAIKKQALERRYGLRFIDRNIDKIKFYLGTT